MSAEQAIIDLEHAGRLAAYLPRSRRAMARRAFLAAGAAAKLRDPRSAVNLLVGRGQIEAALTRWTVGDLVYAEGRRPVFLKRLEPPPPEIWEIRVTEPVSQARIFARFAAPDTLIVTDIYTRDALGRKGSSSWHNACRDCASVWNALFPGSQPFTGSTIHDYVTRNCDDFDI